MLQSTMYTTCRKSYVRIAFLHVVSTLFPYVIGEPDSLAVSLVYSGIADERLGGAHLLV